MQITKRLLVAGGASLALVFAGATAFGQGYDDPGQGQPPGQGQSPGQGYSPSPPPPQAPGGAEVDDQTLERFVQAYGEVQEIRRDLTSKLSNAQDQEQAQQLQQEAQTEMVGAVQDAGLSPDEYNRIASQMANDQELRQRVIDQLEGN